MGLPNDYLICFIVGVKYANTLIRAACYEAAVDAAEKTELMEMPNQPCGQLVVCNNIPTWKFL